MYLMSTVVAELFLDCPEINPLPNTDSQFFEAVKFHLRFLTCIVPVPPIATFRANGESLYVSGIQLLAAKLCVVWWMDILGLPMAPPSRTPCSANKTWLLNDFESGSSAKDVVSASDGIEECASKLTDIRPATPERTRGLLGGGLNTEIKHRQGHHDKQKIAIAQIVPIGLYLSGGLCVYSDLKPLLEQLRSLDELISDAKSAFGFILLFQSITAFCTSLFVGFLQEQYCYQAELVRLYDFYTPFLLTREVCYWVTRCTERVTHSELSISLLYIVLVTLLAMRWLPRGVSATSRVYLRIFNLMALTSGEMLRQMWH